MHPFQGFCQLSSKVNRRYYTIAVHLGNTLGKGLLSKPSCLVLTGLYTKPRHINIALQGPLNVLAACHTGSFVHTAKSSPLSPDLFFIPADWS